MSNTLFAQFQSLQGTPEQNSALLDAMKSVRSHADLLGKMMPDVKVEFLPAVPADKQDAEGKWLESNPIETVEVSIGDAHAQPIYLNTSNTTQQEKAEHGFYAAKDAWLKMYSWDPSTPLLQYYTGRRDLAGALPEEGTETKLASLFSRIGIVHVDAFDAKGFLSVRLNGHSEKVRISQKSTGWFRILYSPLGLELSSASYAEQQKHNLIAFMAAFGAKIVINVSSKLFHYAGGDFNYKKLQYLAQLWRKQIFELSNGETTTDSILADRRTRIIDASNERKITVDAAKDPETQEEVRLGTVTKQEFKINVISAKNPDGKTVVTSTLLDNDKTYNVMAGGRGAWITGKTFTSKITSKAVGGLPKDLNTLNLWSQSGKWLVEVK